MQAVGAIQRVVRASLGVVGIENPVHLLFIGAVALVVLGPKRLPALTRALGEGIREFREAVGRGASETEPADPTERAASEESPG